MEKLRELEKMRGVAILAVVLIHVTASATVYYPLGSLKYLFYNSVNSLVQFAVPLFLFISSLIHSYRLQDNKEPTVTFYKKRLRSSLVPYLLWSFGYALFRSWQGGQLAQFLWLEKRFQELWTGSAYYHLYFFLIILQLYVLLPWLVKIFRKFDFGQTLLSAVIFQSAFYYLNKLFIYKAYPHPGNLLGSYLPIVLLGCWLGLNYGTARAKSEYYKVFLYLFNVVLACGFIFVNIKARSGATLTLGLYYLVYHSFILVTAWNVWLWAIQGHRTDNFFLALGEQAFAIYLIHPFFLEVWYCIWRHGQLINYDLTLGAGFIMVLGLSYLFGLVLMRNSLLSKILLGR